MSIMQPDASSTEIRDFYREWTGDFSYYRYCIGRRGEENRTRKGEGSHRVASLIISATNFSSPRQEWRWPEFTDAGLGVSAA
jgi:hypothetical protein